MRYSKGFTAGRSRPVATMGDLGRPFCVILHPKEWVYYLIKRAWNEWKLRVKMWMNYISGNWYKKRCTKQNAGHFHMILTHSNWVETDTKSGVKKQNTGHFHMILTHSNWVETIVKSGIKSKMQVIFTWY